MGLSLTAFVLAAVFAGCALPRSGTQAQQCTAPSECDDNNPCTVEGCNADGLCTNEPDDSAELTQIENDCTRLECQDGETVEIADDQDFDDDGESCTTDACENGVVVHTPLENGSQCDVAGNGGSCKDGVCEVICDSTNAATKCDDDNACTTDSCNLSIGVCVHDKLDNVAAPGQDQTAGDCQLKLCQAGMVVEVNDNTDLPVDNNPCTGDLCTEGVPSNPDLDINTTCSDGGDPLAKLCDGMGTCVQCIGTSDCSHLPVDDDCQTRTCVANTCGQTFTAVDTAITSQTGGDCQLTVCDGSGGTKQNVDDADLPVDNNDCTKDICTNGTPTNPNEALNYACGANGTLYCDGMGTCSDCTENAQCGTDTFCQAHICNPQTKKCGTNDTSNGTPLPGGSQTSGDCQQLRCNGIGGVKSVNYNSDLPADDGNQCTDETCVNGSPQHPDEALDFSCSQNGGTYCDGNGACVECNSPGQCSGAADCQVDACTNNACATPPEPVNTPAPGSYQTSGDCNLIVCDGNGAVSGTPQVQDSDLPVDGNDCTQDICTSGTPTNPPVAAETPCNQNGGQVCNGDAMNPACVECATDTQCTMPQVCNQATWTCCTPADCTALGKTCGTHADTCGGLVNCSGTKNGSETDVDCGGDVNACTTRCAQGKDCSLASDCTSVLCVDTVCCDTACGDSCDACNLTGNIGTCTPRSDGDAGVPACAGGYLCDGTNATCPNTCSTDGDCASGYYCNGTNCALTKALGVGCGGGNECTSTFCQDGVCCDTACTQGCKACVAAKTPSPDGTCDDIDAGTDPDAECTPGACNGAGVCKGEQGDPCAINSDCLNNICSPDGVCCNNACGGTCESCLAVNTSSPTGTCDFITAGIDPDNECGNAANCEGDNCSGSSGACEFAAAIIECNAKVGTCDVAENCTGSSFGCPADAVEPNTTVCNAKSGVCDVAESCDGVTKTCPVDAVEPNTTVCRPSTEVSCDPAENCDGSLKTCPTDLFASAGTVCGGALTEPTCDPDSCDGSGVCTDNANAPDSTVCSDNGGTECCTGACVGSCGSGGSGGSAGGSGGSGGGGGSGGSGGS